MDRLENGQQSGRIMPGPKMEREKLTVERMARIYCRGKHGCDGELCPECQELLAYARKRLDYCRYGEQKPTCGKCPVHCYKPDMKTKILEVMRYAGPRMIFYHPVNAIQHLLNGRRRV